MLNHKILNERPESQERLIKQLEKMGYTYISRSEAEKKRGNLSSAIFQDELIRFLQKQTYKFKNYELNFSGESITKAINKLDASLLQGLTMASKEIYNLITLGTSVEENVVIDKNEPVKQSFDLNFIDFDYPANNIWQVTEEFQVEKSNGQYARPDIVLLVNGIPFVVIECKKSSVDVKEGVTQNVRNMGPNYIPQLFKYVQLVLAVNPNKVLYGTCGTTADYFVEWKEENFEWQKELCSQYSEDGQIIEQDRIVVSLLEKSRLLNLIHNFILYDANIKKIARHQQFFAVTKAIKRINGEDDSKSKNGVIWHTQGSGKSLTMVMLVKKIKEEKINEEPRFILVTDRINLDKQIRDNFANTQMMPKRATTGKGLKDLLEDKNVSVITTLINKFEAVCKNKYLKNNSENFYILIDEAHRSQYSSMFNYMQEVLPNANLIAFTGTPLIANKKKNTYKKFGNPIHNYTMKNAIADKITVPLIYEGRKVQQDNPNESIDKLFENFTKDLAKEQQEDLKKKYSKFAKLAEASSRINLIAWDIQEHFTNYCIPQKLKAMIVCSSRASAVDMFNVLNRLQGINPKVVITFGDTREGDDDDITTSVLKKIKEYHKTQVSPLFGDNNELYDESVCADFKNPEGETNILIVKDKLLTGFDAPIAGVLYIDKSIKQHSLLQAIARVNRIYENKDFGLIVDYWGIFSKLSEAIDMYNDAESGFNEFDKEDIEGSILGVIDNKNKIVELHSTLYEVFPKFNEKTTVNEWQEFLKDENKRKDFYQKLNEFSNMLNLAFTDRELFKEIGYPKLEEYKKDYLFFRKLKDSVMIRYDDSVDFSKYEDGIKNLIDTFVNATEVTTVVKPVSIDNEKKMKELLEKMPSNVARADAIKSRIESKLEKSRYDDPLLFEEFSYKIKRSLEEYEQSRDEDKYYMDMERLANDIRHGVIFNDYPVSIANDPDTKALYGSILLKLKNINEIKINEELEYKIAIYAFEIKKVIEENTKRDWKHNEIVHKSIHRLLDDNLFNMFADIGYNIEQNIDLLDLIIEEIMKVAVVRY